MDNKLVNRFYRLRAKKLKSLNRLRFLLVCKRQRIIPHFIRLKCNVSGSSFVNMAVYRSHFPILRAVIKETRLDISRIEHELYGLHLKLAGNLLNFWTVDSNSWAHAENLSYKHSVKLKCKISHLLNSCESMPPKDLPIVNQNAVINLSSTVISELEYSVLKLNSNFAKSKKPSFPQLISPVEKAFKNSCLTEIQKENLRHLILANVNFNSIHVKSNLTPVEKSALNNLNSNENIVITKADKGGQIVILDKQHYIDSVKEMLNVGPYVPLSCDPSSQELKHIKSAIKSCPLLPSSLKSHLAPSVAYCSRFYALPKIHKPNIPFRPIVSNIGTASYNLAKYLTTIFSPLLSTNTHTVKNSFNFVNIIQNLSCTNLTMVSFDVKSLFTNVPTSGAIFCLEKRLLEFHFSNFEIKVLLSLTHICLSQTTFVFQGNYYKQTDGLAMGSPLSPILADIYMHYFECALFNKFSFPLWIRYVDDTFTLIDTSLHCIDNILKIMNSVDCNIQFTYETEINGSLSFLDTLVTRSENGFSTSVYRKSFAVSLPPHARSCHPPRQKMAAFHSYINRAIHICSDSLSLNSEINYVKAIAIDRGYNSSIVDKIFSKLQFPRPLRTIQHPASNVNVVLPFFPNSSFPIAKILKKCDFKISFIPTNKLSLSNLKDPIKFSDSWGIYNIPCQCGLSYIGQTKRSLKFRIKEHKQYIRNQDINKSSIAKHCWDNSHVFDFNSATIISKPTSAIELNFLEAFYIYKNQKSIVNSDFAIPPLSDCWKYYIQTTFS